MTQGTAYALFSCGASVPQIHRQLAFNIKTDEDVPPNLELAVDQGMGLLKPALQGSAAPQLRDYLEQGRLAGMNKVIEPGCLPEQTSRQHLS